jgi:AraC-like DNA-binding protein
MACIEQNIKHNPNYCMIERAVCFSYRHIREVFQRTAQISLSRYILVRRIANAAFELRHTKKSITEISFEYEFSNIDTFAKAFRRNTGLTPSEFRKSGYLCGRMIICPGVYAPVILDLVNPRFTLPKLREVNEMGEMKKTSDSCVLYGVPKVYFGREVEGLIQNTPFPMCLQAVLNYMGQNIDYTYLMAATGAAFRQRWDAGGWNFAAMDIRFTYDRPLEPFERGFIGAGRKFNIHVRPAGTHGLDSEL